MSNIDLMIQALQSSGTDLSKVWALMMVLIKPLLFLFLFPIIATLILGFIYKKTIKKSKTKFFMALWGTLILAELLCFWAFPYLSLI